MSPSARRILTFAISLLLAAHAASAAEKITNNLFNDEFSPFHSGMVGDKMLWSEAEERIRYFDGTSTVTIQDYSGADPALDLIATFATGLGSGASASEVVGAWRRGSDYAWVWTSGSAPVAIDVPATNPFVPGGAANPEAFSITDGCVFMISQATDPNDGGSGNVYKNAFQVDPADGSVTPVTGNARAFGPDRIVSSGCRATWVTDPNDDIVVIDAPYELQYWDGSSTVTLDQGRIVKYATDFDRDAIVYVKEVDVYPQLFLIDLGDPTLTPQQITDTLADKASPRTDGRHIAWGERRDHPLTGFFDQMDIRMLGGLRVDPSRFGRPDFSDFSLALEGGQMVWQVSDGAVAQGNLNYHADNVRTEYLGLNLSDVLGLEISDGWMAWYGRYGGENDTEISRQQGVAAQDLSFAPPPMIVQALRGPDDLRVIWDRVLGVDSHTVYVAEEPGIDPSNYTLLAGGARYDQAETPFVISGTDPTKSYYVVVTSHEGGGEGPPSGEAQTVGFVVDTDSDTVDANAGDGICADIAGNCSIRAAIEEAGRIEYPMPTVAIPAGFYVLTLQGSDDSLLLGDLDLRSQMRIVGAGIDQTVLHGGGTAEAVFHVDPNEDGFGVWITDMSIRNAEQGINNEGELRLDRVRIHDNGGAATFQTGAAIGTPLEKGLLELYDCKADNNITGSHGGGLFLGQDADIFRSEISGNTAGLGGGGLYVIRGRTRVTDTTVRDNTSNFSQNWGGGGIYHENGEMLLRRSAVLNNTSPVCGGGIYTSGDRTSLISSTVSGNHSDEPGGGICTVGGVELEMANSTFAFNTAIVAPTLLVGGGTYLRPQSSIFHNEQGDSDCVTQGGYALSPRGMSIGDLVDCFSGSTTFMNVPPLLEPLADNGGFTLSHALQAGSPALDAVPEGACNDRLGDPVQWDQRNEIRPTDYDNDGLALCDSGAVEAEVACIDSDGDGFPAAASPGCLAGVPLDCNDADGDSWQLPGANGTLLFADSQNFSWVATSSPGGDPLQLVHQILRGEDPFDLSVGAVCGAAATGVTAGTDSTLPAPGGIFVYLTRPTNGCSGTPSWGADSDGGERTAVCP